MSQTSFLNVFFSGDTHFIENIDLLSKIVNKLERTPRHTLFPTDLKYFERCFNNINIAVKAISSYRQYKQ